MYTRQPASNGIYQIAPYPESVKNKCTKKEVGGRGGAYKLINSILVTRWCRGLTRHEFR